MALVADRAAVAGPHGPLLLPTSLTAEPGVVTLVMADPGPSCTALALALGGRLALTDGEITLNGEDAPRIRRDRVALVDVPGVTEPEGGLPVGVVVGEELALAGAPSRQSDIDEFLRGEEVLDRKNARWEELAPARQTDWLCRAAAVRPGVDTLVITSPDRRGGPAKEWYAVAEDHARQGRTVVVLATHASARILGIHHDEHTFEGGVA